MLQFLSNLWKRWSIEGIHVPFIYDPESNSPSITLMFFWISSILSIVSLTLLHLKLVTYTATGMSLGFVLTGFVMYRLRKLDKVKLDLDDESIELENNDNDKKKDSK